MSFECGYCGKGSVNRPGEMCSECQEREQFEQDAAQEEWYWQSALCQRCGWAWGPDASDNCGHYNMPLSMVKRKKKCKHFEPSNPQLDDNSWIYDEIDWDEGPRL